MKITVSLSFAHRFFSHLRLCLPASCSASSVYAPSPLAAAAPPSPLAFPPSPVSEDESALDLKPLAAVAPAAKRRRTKGGVWHQCSMCPKLFASPSQLEEHFTYRHSDARTHVCAQCSKVFKTKSNLNQHLRTHAGNRLSCAACPGRTFTESGYRYHLLTKHSDDAVRRRFQCHLCPPGARSFAQNKLLQKHLAARHSDERKHECPHCPQTFKRGDHLARHVSDTHSLVDKLFECSAAEDCGLRFQSQRRLRQHENLHRAAAANCSSCAECGKVFLKRANLAEHVAKAHVKVEYAVTSDDVFMTAAVAEDIVSSFYAEESTRATAGSLSGSSGDSSGGEDLDEELQRLLLDGLLAGDEAVGRIAVDLFA